MTAECMDEAEAAVLLSETSAKPLDFRDRPEQAAYGRPKLTARAASKYLQDTFGGSRIGSHSGELSLGRTRTKVL